MSALPPPVNTAPSVNELAEVYRDVFRIEHPVQEYHGAEDFARSFKRCSLHEDENVSYSSTSSR